MGGALRLLGVVVLVVAAACADGSDDTTSDDTTGATGPAGTAGPTTTTRLDLPDPTPATTRPPATTTPGESPPPTGSDQPVYERGDIDRGLQPFIDMAVADLAGRLGIAEDEIETVAAVLVVWSDAGLGCPEPGRAYAQVPVDGSVIELEAGGRIYRYHTGGDQGPFLCDRPLGAPPAKGDAGLSGGGSADS